MPARSSAPVLPVTVIAGYLGAGKTTLVNQLLRHADGQRLAILVNEFGALPIDADLIEAQDDQLISIAGGCVCCSYGNDLIAAMMELAALDPAPDHIVIEASGVALPGAIAGSVSLLDGFGMDGIIVLADAETIRDQAANTYVGDTITRQLAEADMVVLTKADLVTDIAEVTGWITPLAPQAAVITAQHGQVPNALVLQGFAPDIARYEATGHGQLVSFQSDVLHFDSPVDAEGIAQILAEARFDLIRAKGFVPTRDGPRAIQIVGRRWAVSEAPDDAAFGVVVIAHANGLDTTALRQAIAMP